MRHCSKARAFVRATPRRVRAAATRVAIETLAVSLRAVMLRVPPLRMVLRRPLPTAIRDKGSMVNRLDGRIPRAVSLGSDRTGRVARGPHHPLDKATDSGESRTSRTVLAVISTRCSRKAMRTLRRLPTIGCRPTTTARIVWWTMPCLAIEAARVPKRLRRARSSDKRA